MSTDVRIFTKGLFSLDGETHYEGYNEPDVYWNGFEVPYFTKEIAEKIVSDNSETLSWNGEVILEKEEGYEDEDSDTTEPIVINVNGKELKVWCIGGFKWVWSRDMEKDVQNLSIQFSLLLQEQLGERDIDATIARNKKQSDKNICHSHDFCDANEVMNEAFQKVFGRELDSDSDFDASVWNNAWKQAKENNFFIH